jgi:hypothetical protein
VSTIGAVQPATLAHPALATRTCRAGLAAAAAIQTHLQLLNRKIPGNFQTHLRTRCSRVAITTIETVMAATGLTPGATTRLTVGTGEAGITGGTGSATGIQQ